MAWRQQIHQNPELRNRDFKTAELIVQHLKALNLEVKTNVGHPAVVAVLKGGNSAWFENVLLVPGPATIPF